MKAKPRKMVEQMTDEGNFPAIERIPYPAGIQGYLERLEARTQAIVPEDLHRILETGDLPHVPMPRELRTQYLAYELVEALNDVIDCMNIVIADLRDLPIVGPGQKGKPSQRLSLLVRSFYGELYRGREFGRKMFRLLCDEGFLPRTSVDAINLALAENFKLFMDRRHNLAHADTTLGGLVVNMLRAAEGMTDEERRADTVFVPLPSVIQRATEMDLKLAEVAARAFRDVYHMIVFDMFGEVPDWMEEDGPFGLARLSD